MLLNEKKFYFGILFLIVFVKIVLCLGSLVSEMFYFFLILAIGNFKVLGYLVLCPNCSHDVFKKKGELFSTYFPFPDRCQRCDSKVE